MTPRKIIRNVRVLEHVSQVPTRDAILSAVNPNDRQQSVIAGTIDPGAIWDGIFNALESLPDAPRDEVGRRLMTYADAQGWKIDASGPAHTTDDGHRATSDAARQGHMSDTIRSMNDANRDFWCGGSAASAATRTTDGALTDRRHAARDGAQLAGATRELVASINLRNVEFWASIDGTRTTR